jgi:hypothetical protein
VGLTGHYVSNVAFGHFHLILDFWRIQECGLSMQIRIRLQSPCRLKTINDLIWILTLRLYAERSPALSSLRKLKWMNVSANEFHSCRTSKCVAAVMKSDFGMLVVAMIVIAALRPTPFNSDTASRITA